MILKRLSSILLASTLLLSSLSQASAQSKEPVGLLADNVDYDATSKVLTAKGGVRVVSNGQILSTQSIIYHQTTGQLIIPNGFTITNADGSVMTGTNAELSSDLSTNIIKGARILIANQFQLAADQAQYKDNRFKVLDRVVASTCYIGKPSAADSKLAPGQCKIKPTPFWQIRSKRVIHDELERQLYFENARLEFLGVPIFYAPLLRLPDPTVDRATGFLVPTFFSSDLLKFGVKVPYFIAIDDNSDATVTAFASSVGSFVLEGQYRRETKRGSYQFSGSLLLVDDIENNPFRSLLQGSGRFALSSDYDWGFDIDVVSDKTFRAQYGYEDEDEISAQDRLLSEVFLERNRTNSFFRVSASIFQSLRTNEIDAEIPLVFPNVYFRNIADDPLLGGKLGYTLHTTTLLREANSQFSRIGISADWQREWRLKNGILLGARTQVDAEYYKLSDSYTGFTGTSSSRVTPTISADIRWPLSKVIGSSTHVIEPIAQLVWNEDSLDTVPNEDSIQVEFEETNLFSLNRFPGFDQKELGLRANVGVNYTIYNPSGWSFGATAGRVFRKNDLNQFSTASGLSGKNSDWVSAFTLRFPKTFELTNRTLFDSKFNLSKNETSLNFIYRKWQGEATYLRLQEDIIAGASDRRSEAALKLIYTPHDNWEYLAEWRHDFVTNSAIEGEFGLKYINECIEIDLSLSLQYAASGNVTSTKELGLRVSFVGIGNQARAKGRRRRCAL
jgi:LPS-assembly protein